MNSNKKKILVFSLAWYPFESGGEMAPRMVAEHLSDEYEFDIITYRFKSEWLSAEKVGGVTVYRVGGPTKYGYIVRAFFMACVFNRKNRYDAIWSIMAGYSGGAAYWFKRFHPKIPLLLTLQEGDPIEHIMRRVGVARPWFLDLFKRADAVQAISNYLASLAKQLGFLGTPVVVPNGVDIEKFIDSNPPKQFPRNGKEIVLINTSRLVYKNAHDIVIRALRYLPGNVVYKNVAQQGDLGEELLALAKKEGVSDRVFLLPGLPMSRIPEWLHAGDILVRPSRSEGLGSSFLEAMAAGLPIVATPVGGIPDFLKDRVTGFFCRVDDPESLSEQIKFIINPNNKIFVDKIVNSALSLVKEKYSWQTVAEDMRKIFVKLI